MTTSILKQSVLLIVLFFIYSPNLATNICTSENIIIRPATINDLEAIGDLNKQILYDHFKPIYIQHYAHLPIGQNTDYFLELDIKNEMELFYKCAIDPENIHRLLLAYDREKEQCIGFVLFYKNNTTLEIDLLYVDKNYRNLGIGRKLINKAISTFIGINSCVLFVLKFNERAIKFYESIGFVNLGSEAIDKNAYAYRSPYRELFFKCRLKINKKPNFASSIWRKLKEHLPFKSKND